MVINFVIISVTPFLTKSYYYTAGAMITFAAFGTTCYNKYWLHRKLRLAGPASLPAMPQEQVQETQEIIQAEPVPVADMLPDEAQDEPAPSDDVPQMEHDEPVLTADVPQKEHGEPAIPQEIPSALPEEAAIPVNEPVPMPVETDVETDQDADDELAATLAAMTTMDQLLDFAFEHNMQKDHPVALTAYMEALARYREDSYAPFIVVSIANIHKELGNYQAAIDSIQSAMDLPALLESESIRKQFEDTRLYLAATQKVLHKAGLGNISFKDIPKEYMSQIESIYNSRKSR